MLDAQSHWVRMSPEYLLAKLLRKMRGRAIHSSTVHPSSTIEAGSQFVHSTMDKHSFCGYDCDIAYCDIGSFCSLANEVVIGGGMHPAGWVSTSPAFYEGRDSIGTKFSEHTRSPRLRTHIGHDVWIGQRCLIKQGVTIGTGAIIGMGSVVTRDVPPYAVVGGVPAGHIRNRFASDIADRLLASEWWTLPEKELHRLGALVREPDKFLAALR